MSSSALCDGAGFLSWKPPGSATALARSPSGLSSVICWPFFNGRQLLPEPAWVKTGIGWVFTGASGVPMLATVVFVFGSNEVTTPGRTKFDWRRFSSAT